MPRSGGPHRAAAAEPSAPRRAVGLAAVTRRADGERRLQCRHVFWRSGMSTASERAGRSPTGHRARIVAQQHWPARSVGARGGHEGPVALPGPHPTAESTVYATRTSRCPPATEAVDAATPVDANSRAHRSLQNRGRGFAQRPQPSSSSASRPRRSRQHGKSDGRRREMISFSCWLTLPNRSATARVTMLRNALWSPRGTLSSSLKGGVAMYFSPGPRQDHRVHPITALWPVGAARCAQLVTERRGAAAEPSRVSTAEPVALRAVLEDVRRGGRTDPDAAHLVDTDGAETRDDVARDDAAELGRIAGRHLVEHLERRRISSPRRTLRRGLASFGSSDRPHPGRRGAIPPRDEWRDCAHHGTLPAAPASAPGAARGIPPRDGWRDCAHHGTLPAAPASASGAARGHSPARWVAGLCTPRHLRRRLHPGRCGGIPPRDGWRDCAHHGTLPVRRRGKLTPKRQ